MIKEQEDLMNIENLDINGEYYFNWFQDGGAMVIRTSKNEWNIYEVSQYGINTWLEGCYTKDNLVEMIRLGYSWL